MKSNLQIRPIVKSDNAEVCSIIKSNLKEYNAALKGTAYYDNETQAMFEAYQEERSMYYVALLNNKLVAGCGIKQLQNAASNYCELQKMYMRPEARGKKIGKELIFKCIDFAIKSKYQYCSIETFPQMKEAINLYQKNGFELLDAPLGNTNHYACNVWLLKDLNQDNFAESNFV